MKWKYQDEQWGSRGDYDAPQIWDVTNPDTPKIVATVAVRAEMKKYGILLAAAPQLLHACQKAKKLLEPEVTKEPDRAIFWTLVAAISAALPGADWTVKRK